MNKKFVIFISCITFLLGCFILSVGFSNIAREERTVSVRGFSEKEVDADFAVWKIAFSVGANDLISLEKEISEKTKIVTGYLKNHGLEDADFSVLAPEINDASMSLYTDPSRRTYNYIAKQSLLIRTQKIKEVKEASSDTLKLIGKGISVSSDYDNHVTYEFTRLNEIKPEMIASATQSARAGAEQFAKDSGSKVGKIKSATQGLFTIENAAEGLEERKNVRVVTTVVYILKD
ncbi:SIMPL domain-containing protein [Treponema pectinovorum]|uniref:SIMPL domain-containing protein n=1 Tax=Treponema pectinovorum TaxID=164 RepID=UPI0011C92274|nr:SIMPL domain-containing protein [Treponema pectinovorum]